MNTKYKKFNTKICYNSKIYNTKRKIKRGLSNHSKFAFILLIFMLIGLITNNLSNNQSEILNDLNENSGLKLQGDDFSDELSFEDYTSQELLSYDWYDAQETFFYDRKSYSPMSMLVRNKSLSYSYITQDYAEHWNSLAMLDNGNTENTSATMFFNNMLLTDNVNLDFWFYARDIAYNLSIYFNQNQSNYLTIRDNYIFYHINESTEYSTPISNETISSQEWNHIKLIFFFEDSITYISVILNNWCYYLALPFQYNGNNILEIDSITFQTSIPDYSPFYIYLIDAISCYSTKENDLTQILNQENEVMYYYDYYLMAKGYLEQCSEFPLNYFCLGQEKYMSMRSSLMNENPSEDNNYRTSLISDKIITDNYIDKNRVLRLEGSDTIQNKYKVMQFYFNDLNETESFTNQTEEFNKSGYYDYELNDGYISSVDSLKSIDQNNFTIKNQISEHYNGTFSFTSDSVGSNPSGWTVTENEPDDYLEVISNYDNHDKVVHMERTSAVANVYMYQSLSNIEYGSYEYWYQIDDANTRCTLLNLYQSGSSVFYIESRYDTFRYSDGTYHTITDCIDNTWYHIKIDFECTTGGYLGLSEDTFMITINGIEYGAYGFNAPSDYADKISCNTAYYQNCYYDAIGYNWDYDESGIYSYNIGDNLYPNSDELINISYSSNELDSGYSYSIETMFSTNISSIVNISLYNYLNNSYVLIFTNLVNSLINFEYSITNISNYLYENRVNILFECTNSSNMEVRIDFLNFLNIQNTSTYGNHTLLARIDSFDSDDILMNMYFLSIAFNKTEGVINWNALYRESYDVPRWTDQPTNPIFRFSDYMEEGTVLTDLQVNIHVFLTEANNQKYIYIRTQVCINNYYDMQYQYDKIIDAGNSDFYDNQSRLLVRYVDYFNDNEYNETVYSEYHEPITTRYVYNNLAGYRFLMLNSTLMKYNFLECGYYLSDLDISPQPEPTFDDPNDPLPDEPDVPDRPEQPYEHYWELTAFWWVSYDTTTLTIGTEDPYIDQWGVDFESITMEEVLLPYPYYPEAFDYLRNSDFPSATFRVHFGSLGSVKFDFSWLRNIVKGIGNFFIGIINGVLLFLQMLLYGVIWVVCLLATWLFVWMFVSFWNYAGAWGTEIGYWAFWYVVWALTRFIWLWDEILLPLFEWFLTDALPFLIDLFIEVWAIIIAVVLTILSGEEIGGDYYNNVLDNSRDMLTKVGDFLLESITLCIENFDAVLMAVALYIIFLILCYGRYWYALSQGNVERADEYKASWDSHMLPIRTVFNLYDRLKNSVPTA